MSTVPTEWKPNPDIVQLPLRYHQGRTVTSTDSTPETGFPIHPRIRKLVYARYPQYIPILQKYCRPLGTTIATFNDFNKSQSPVQESSKERQDRIISHIHYFLDTKPYLPLHFVDTGFAKTPLNTGTGYHNRQSFKMNAKYSHPEEYKE